jgi:hypothetical protein
MTIDKTRAKTPRGTLPAFTPVPRHYQRHDGWTPERQRGFIEALADLGSIRAAANTVNMTPESAYQLRRHPEAGEFRKAWEAALACGVQRIEDVAMERALHGVELPVYSYGKLVGTRISYNDRLLMFMLRNRARKRFTGGGGARGLNAVDAGRLKRLKAEWRKEWEEEQAANSKSPAEVQASIERKVAALRRRVIWETSPRAAELQYMAQAQRHADTTAGWRPCFDYADYAKQAAALLPQFIEEVKAEWPEPEPFDPKEYAEWEEEEDGWEELEREVPRLAGPEE